MQQSHYVQLNFALLAWFNGYRVIIPDPQHCGSRRFTAGNNLLRNWLSWLKGEQWLMSFKTMTDMSRRTGNHMVHGQGTIGICGWNNYGMWKIYTDQRILYGHMYAVRKTAGEILNSRQCFVSLRLFYTLIYLYSTSENWTKYQKIRHICCLNLQENMFK